MKQFLLFILILVFSSVSFAQVFHGGVLAGITASQVDGDTYAGFDKLGFQGGVFVTTPITHGIDARMEIKFTSRGAKNPASEDNTGFYKLGLYYIDLPVLAAIKVKQLGSIEFGLIPGYLFAATGEDDYGKIPEESLVDFHKFDLGTLLGISFNISEKIALNFRYSYSVLSIRDLGSENDYYSWLGNLFGFSEGDYNNYMTFGVNYLIK
jgi:hypothetical protein